MSVHRAAYLGSPTTDHAGRVALVTYNRALLAYFGHLGAHSLANVDVLNYHKFALGYLSSIDEMGYGWIVNNDGERSQLIREALSEVRTKHGNTGVLRRDDGFFFSELRYMAQHGLLGREAYLAAERVGRGQALAPAARPLVLEVLDAYHLARARNGRRYDWDDVASAVRRGFEADDRTRYYQHVVIDEGQDFSPEMLRSLALAIPEDGSLTFFGDVAQQIYGRGISWRNAGLRVPAAWRFEHNYRNTQEIAKLGLAIATMPYFRELPDMVAPTGLRASGPPPTLVHLDDIAAETKFVLDQAQEAAQGASVAILVSRHSDEARFAAKLPNAQRLHRDLASWDGGPGISYGTFFAAKGFEFDTVILVGLTADLWPEPMAVAADGLEEAEAIAGRLLYVGVTRARQNLIMTVTGAPTKLLPENKDLWTELTL
jgi:superfamily I DNA/RNA helicase